MVAKQARTWWHMYGEGAMSVAAVARPRRGGGGTTTAGDGNIHTAGVGGISAAGDWGNLVIITKYGV